MNIESKFHSAFFAESDSNQLQQGDILLTDTCKESPVFSATKGAENQFILNAEKSPLEIIDVTLTSAKNLRGQ